MVKISPNANALKPHYQAKREEVTKRFIERRGDITLKELAKEFGVSSTFCGRVLDDFINSGGLKML